jgi:hypothetical protein
MSNALLEANYLFVGPLIEQRLRTLVADLPVEGIEDMAQAVDAQDRRKCVAYVMWGGDRFPESAAGGEAAALYQQWVVWLRVLNASSTDKDARSTAAGGLLSGLHKALAGWKPEGCFRGLKRTGGPRPNYQTTSGLYPLAFEIQLHL